MQYQNASREPPKNPRVLHGYGLGKAPSQKVGIRQAGKKAKGSGQLSRAAIVNRAIKRLPLLKTDLNGNEAVQKLGFPLLYGPVANEVEGTTGQNYLRYQIWKTSDVAVVLNFVRTTRGRHLSQALIVRRPNPRDFSEMILGEWNES